MEAKTKSADCGIGGCEEHDGECADNWGQGIPVVEGFIGVCYVEGCGYETSDLPTKSLVSAAMVRHFDATGHDDWERIG